MSALALVFGMSVLLAGMSVRAHRRLPPAARLPMSFGPGGRPGWCLPRRAALAFTPGLAAAVLVSILALPGADPADQALAVMLTGAGFVAAHGLYLRLLSRRGRSG
jgi:hypothetical protein